MLKETLAMDCGDMQPEGSNFIKEEAGEEFGTRRGRGKLEPVKTETPGTIMK